MAVRDKTPEARAARTEYNRRWRAANPDKVAAWRPGQNAKQNAKRKAERDSVIDAYGAVCSCSCGCGESVRGFLTLDHIDGLPDHHRHPETGKRLPGTQVFKLILAEFKRTGETDPTMRVLCFNCNSGRAANGGVCPREEVVP